MSTIEDWRGRLGRDWAERADQQDRFLAPLGELGMERLGPVEGARVLDLGCGGGATTLALHERGAQPVGVDVSPDLLSVAERRAQAARARVRFVLTDAGKAPPPGPFDALFSRFGCMFFDDPMAAWATLRGQMAEGARLAAVAWRSLKVNDWAGLPLRLAGDLTEAPPRQPRGAPGPFGWAEPEVVQPWLEAAGWKGIRWEEADVTLACGIGDDPDPVERAVRFGMEVGPLASRLRGAPEAVRAEAEARLREGMAEHVRDGAAQLRGAVWIVTAQA
jgi:SAM-dependent methyltransferase